MIASFDSEQEAENLRKYLRTKFARFMIALVKNTQNLARGGFRFLPVLNMEEEWNDEKLFSYFGINHDEIEFIDSIVRPME